MKIIITALFFQFLMLTNSIAKSNIQPQYKVLQSKQLTHDFFIRQVERPAVWSNASATNESVDCVAKIKSMICLAENSNSPCYNSQEIQVEKVILIYHQLPPFFQKGFCSLTQIRIEQNMNSTAYATTDVDENWQIVGGIVGINQAALVSEKNFSNWISWKEQLNFGGSETPGVVTAGLPTIEANAQIHDPLLTYVMIHELSHIFDMANQVQKTWGPEFWENEVTPKRRFDLSARDRFCYYNCNGHFISTTDAVSIYTEIESSIFPNSYSMMSSMEDFAEVSALYFWSQYPGATYKIHASENKIYDVLAKLSTAVMKWKVNFVKMFYNDKQTKPGLGPQIKPLRRKSNLTI